jgi:hypothetical protein
VLYALSFKIKGSLSNEIVQRVVGKEEPEINEVLLEGFDQTKGHDLALTLDFTAYYA